VVGGYSEGYSYDNRARLASTTVVADGGSYVLSQSYKAATGQLETITYPASTGASPFKIKYEYDTANQSGLLRQVKDFNAGTVFWQAISSNALNQYQDVTLGNGLKTLTAFDSITGVINRIESGPSGGNTRQHLQYVWDKLGNLSSRQDLNIAKTETFEYDHLYRMIEAQVGANAALTVGYNAMGNITSKSDVGAYAYHPGKKHAVASAGAITMSYDANGNIETQASPSGTATLTWTAYNLPKLISVSTGRSSAFLYGPDRQRYKHVAVTSGITETTIYVKGIFEKVTRPFGTEYRHFILGPEGVLAIHNRKSSGTNETRYLLKDHLGSTDVITDEAGASRVKLSFGAFGGRRNGGTWTGSPTSSDQIAIASTSRLAFTGHEQLDHLDLVHMNGRVYQPLLGRFISADPFVQDPFNSQSLNRYSYVFNNPLTFTDPSGFQAAGPDGGGGGGFTTVGFGFGSRSNPAKKHKHPNAPSKAPAPGVSETQTTDGGGFGSTVSGLPGISRVSGTTCGAGPADDCFAADVRDFDLGFGASFFFGQDADLLFEAVEEAAQADASRFDIVKDLIFPLDLNPGVANSEFVEFGAGRAFARTARALALRSVKLGARGESLVRSVYKIGKKGQRVLVNGRERIPDGLSPKILSEVKNVRALSYTQQLRDFAQVARRTGRRFDLYIRRGTQPSKELLDAAQRGEINLRIIPGT
jgi:RHS repeat-associated protein